MKRSLKKIQFHKIKEKCFKSIEFKNDCISLSTKAVPIQIVNPNASKKKAKNTVYPSSKNEKKI